MCSRGRCVALTSFLHVTAQPCLRPRAPRRPVILSPRSCGQRRRPATVSHPWRAHTTAWPSSRPSPASPTRPGRPRRRGRSHAAICSAASSGVDPPTAPARLRCRAVLRACGRPGCRSSGAHGAAIAASGAGPGHETFPARARRSGVGLRPTRQRWDAAHAAAPRQARRSMRRSPGLWALVDRGRLLLARPTDPVWEGNQALSHS